ncbi:MAG TPA: hypothetical protein VFH51_02270, partial [Myxococcota bacterium]|nr:hypothetical protein [Myxococcota bacterium]
MTNSNNLLDDLDVAIPEEGAVASAPTGDGGASQFVGPDQLIQEVGAGGVARVHRARHIHPQYADKPLAV